LFIIARFDPAAGRSIAKEFLVFLFVGSLIEIVGNGLPFLLSSSSY